MYMKFSAKAGFFYFSIDKTPLLYYTELFRAWHERFFNNSPLSTSGLRLLN